VEIEVVLVWIGGNITDPLRQAGALVFTWDEVAHHTRIVRGSRHVRRTHLGVWASCIDQARRVAATKADHWGAAAGLPIAVRCVVNVRGDERRLPTVHEGRVGNQRTVGAQLEGGDSRSLAVWIVGEALQQIIEGHGAKQIEATVVGALVPAVSAAVLVVMAGCASSNAFTFQIAGISTKGKALAVRLPVASHLAFI